MQKLLGHNLSDDFHPTVVENQIRMHDLKKHPGCVNYEAMSQSTTHELNTALATLNHDILS